MSSALGTTGLDVSRTPRLKPGVLRGFSGCSPGVLRGSVPRSQRTDGREVGRVKMSPMEGLREKGEGLMRDNKRDMCQK